MPDSAATPSSFPADLRAAFPLDDLFAAVWEASLTALVLLQPVWDEKGGEITDFTLELLNEAGQRMLGQPARPAPTHAQLFPHTVTNGLFDFYREVFKTGQPGEREFQYQDDESDNYFRVSARRVAQGLVVSFTDTAEESSTAAALALRASQARERTALAEAERQRTILHQAFMQAPAMICILAGPEYVFELVNPLYQQAVGTRSLLGRPIREALPELIGQLSFGLLDRVYTTGETFRTNEVPVQSSPDHAGSQAQETRYYNFIYQARRAANGEVDGLIVFAYEVTEQVRAQQQVADSKQQTLTANQELALVNQELATANEELQAANEEIRATNDDLFLAQLTLQELNQELEARVADRTARLRAAQAEAERQRDRLERFFMQAPAAICILDGPDLVFELVNPAYQALFPGRALTGRALLKALPELAGHAVWDSLRRVYETGATHREEAILIPVARHEGEPLEDLYFNYVQQARYDENGRIDGILVFAFEVTEQVLARRRSQAFQAEALQHAAQLVRQRETMYQVFEQTPAGVAILRGPEHYFEYVNPGYQALFPGRTLLGLPLVVALPETAEFGFVALLDRVYATGEPFFGTELPLQVRDEAGHLLPEAYFTFTYQAYQEAGATVGVSIFAFDVSEQVRARQQATALQAEVSLRDAQLQDLFEQAPVAIAVLRGPEFVVELANPGMCALWGHTRDEVLGKRLLVGMPELQGQGFDLLLEGVMATGVAYATQEKPAQLQRNGHSQTVYLNFVYQPLRDPEGHVVGVAVVATDVSEQVAARQLLARANAELTAANQAVSARNEELAATNQQLTRTNEDLDNFVYAASHDLKQPVNNLAGLFDELRQATSFSDPDEEAMLVPMVDEALRQLAATINDLAAVGQVQRLPDLPAETVALDELTQEVLHTLQPQVYAARARVTTDFTARPTVTYARASLRTIVLNLLSNALKYADPSRPARVHLSVWVQEDRPVLLVEDNGLGFDVQRHRDELFHLFRRFHDHTEGTGVGLYLINRIVQSNGGRVEVESEIGEGTTFRVFL